MQKIMFLLMMMLIGCSKNSINESKSVSKNNEETIEKLISTDISIVANASNLSEITTVGQYIYKYTILSANAGKVKAQINYINGISFNQQLSTCSNTNYLPINASKSCVLALNVDASILSTGIYPVNIQVSDFTTQSIVKNNFFLINVAIPVADQVQSNSNANSTCKTNSHIEGRKCVLNTRIMSCQGSIPAANASLNNGSTYTQTWSNGVWSSPVSYFYSQATDVCSFSCDAETAYNSSTNTCDPSATQCTLGNYTNYIPAVQGITGVAGTAPNCQVSSCDTSNGYTIDIANNTCSINLSSCTVNPASPATTVAPFRQFNIKQNNGIGFDQHNRFNSSDMISGNTSGLFTELFPDGNSVYAVTNRGLYNGTYVSNIIKLDNNGFLDTSFNLIPSLNLAGNYTVPPLSKAFKLNDKIWIIGDSQKYNFDVNAGNYIRRLNLNGTLDSTYTGIANITGVNDALVLDDGSIILIGTFEGVGNVYTGRRKIVKLTSSGVVDTNFISGLAGNGLTTVQKSGTDGVQKVYKQNDGKLIITGAFNFYSGIVRNKIARINSNGSLDTTFMATETGFWKSGSYVAPFSVIEESDGYYMFGDFTQYNSNVISTIVKLDSNGSFDYTYNTTNTFLTNVRNLVTPIFGATMVKNNGSYYLFNVQETSSGNYYGIMKLNADGTKDTSFSPYLNPTIASYPLLAKYTFLADGNIVYNDQVLNKIVKINRTTGELFSNYNKETGFTTGKLAQVTSSQAVGQVLLAEKSKDNSGWVIATDGYLTKFDGVLLSQNYFFKLDMFGNIVSSFNLGGTGPNNIIKKIVPVNDGYFLLGDFTTYNGVAVPKLIKVNLDGSLNTTFTYKNTISPIFDFDVSNVDPTFMIVATALSSYNGITISQKYGYLLPLNSTTGDFDEYSGKWLPYANTTAPSVVNGAVYSVKFASYNGNNYLFLLGNFTQLATTNSGTNAVNFKYFGRLAANGQYDAGTYWTDTITSMVTGNVNQYKIKQSLDNSKIARFYTTTSNQYIESFDMSTMNKVSIYQRTTGIALNIYDYMVYNNGNILPVGGYFNSEGTMMPTAYVFGNCSGSACNTVVQPAIAKGTYSLTNDATNDLFITVQEGPFRFIKAFDNNENILFVGGGARALNLFKPIPYMGLLMNSSCQPGFVGI